MFKLFFKNLKEKVALTNGEKTAISEKLKSKEIKKGQFLLRANEICNYIVFIEKGVLRTYLKDKSGFEHVIFFGLEGWTSGDLNSFMRQQPARFYIDALEDCELTIISKTDHDLLIETIPAFESYMRILMTNAYMASLSRTSDLISLSLEERYKNFITSYPSIIQRVPQYMIASHLGVSPETLSRLRAKIVD
tara:strand:- start:335 stop:910 length:576 start_codon:yes stop_codon:yes gene_type:complete